MLERWFDQLLYRLEKWLGALHCLLFVQHNWRDIGGKDNKRVYLCVNCGCTKNSTKTLEEMNK